MISERESGGKPKNRYSWLEHLWTFSMQPGATLTFFMNGWLSLQNDGDHFEFYYSTDGQDYFYMFDLVKTAVNLEYQKYVLPPGTSGSMYIKVVDTDHTPGNRAIDTVHVEHMYIHSENQPGDPPIAPDSLNIIGLSEGTLNLVWNDNSDNESGFYLERSLDQSSWTLFQVGENQTTYPDSGLPGDTTQYYRISAYNGSGQSGHSNITSGTTPLVKAATLHLDNLEDLSIPGSKKWTAIARIFVRNNSNQLMANALVEAAWSGGAKGTGSCMTNALGYCDIQKDGLRNNLSSVALTVDNVTLFGHNYDLLTNSNGDTIVLDPTPD
jgi:hypothetical protein